MGKKEKIVLFVIFILIFLEFVKYGLAVRVLMGGFIGYMLYKKWRK